MTTVQLSATEARRWMNESMEGCALNDEQTNLLYNPDPEINSVLELCHVALARGVAPDLIGDLLRLTRQTMQSNFRERGIHFEFAGVFDALSVQLMDAERNGHGPGRTLTVKELGRRLRPALQMLRAGGDAVVLAPHWQTVEDVFRSVPSGQLFTESVRRELREPNYQLLCRLHRARLGHMEAAA